MESLIKIQDRKIWDSYVRNISLLADNKEYWIKFSQKLAQFCKVTIQKYTQTNQKRPVYRKIVTEHINIRLDDHFIKDIEDFSYARSNITKNRVDEGK